MPSGIKRTHEDFLIAFSENNSNHSNITVLEKYKTNTTPIRCKCNVCGFEWAPTPKSLLANHGCPKCSGNVKFSHSEFVEIFSKKNPYANTIQLIGTYQSMSQKIKCRCSLCSYEWDACCGDLLYSKTGCPQCSGRTTLSHEKFISNLEKNNPNFENIIFLSKYEGSMKRISCKCKMCGYEWQPLATSLSQGSGCPMCAKKYLAQISGEQLRKLPKPTPISHEEFLDKLSKRNPYSDIIEITSLYCGAIKPIKCRCKKCGTEWNTIATSLLLGSGCPKCSHSSTSFMEQYIATALAFALGKENIIQRDKACIGKELDIYLPKKQLAVEIGSWKWHKSTFKNDLQKKASCLKKNIRLIIIYDSCDGIPEEQSDIYHFDFDLGSENGHRTLQSLIFIILKEIGVKYSFSSKEWGEITQLSYDNSQRISHSDFITKFNASNPSASTIEILSSYTRAIDKIKCRCRVCNNVWETAATELLRGSGCPKCKIAQVGRNKSKQNTIKEWRKNNPNGSKLLCEKETGISRVTVYKWWDSV